MHLKSCPASNIVCIRKNTQAYYDLFMGPNQICLLLSFLVFSLNNQICLLYFLGKSKLRDIVSLTSPWVLFGLDIDQYISHIFLKQLYSYYIYNFSIEISRWVEKPICYS